MALSGTFSQKKNGLTFKIDWTAVQDQQANTSTITLHYWWIVEISTWCSGTTILTNLAGQEQKKTGVGKIGFAIKNDEGGTEIYGQTGTVDCGTHVFTCQHSADGTGRFQLSSSFAYGSSIDRWKQTIEAEIVVDTIPRQTGVSVQSGVEKSAVSISLSIASPAFNHKLTYSIAGAAETTIATNVTAATYSWTLPEILPLCSATEKSKPVTVFCYTYDSAGQQIGKTSAAGTISLSEQLRKPGLSVTYSCTDYSGLTGSRETLISNVSDVTVTASATPAGNAIISEITCAGSPLQNGAAKTFFAVTGENFGVSVRDSRGFTNITDKVYEIVPYMIPSCSFDARIDIESGSMEISARGQAFHGSFGAAQNTAAAFARTRQHGGTWGEWTALSTSFEYGNSWNAAGVLTGTDYDKKWEVEVKIQDALKTIFAESQIISGIPVYYWNDEEFISNVPISAPGVTALELQSDSVTAASVSAENVTVSDTVTAKHLLNALMLAEEKSTAYRIGTGGDYTDFNDVKRVGVYQVFTTNGGLSNSPVDGNSVSGSLIVRTAEGTEEKDLTRGTYIYLQQIFIPRSSDAIYMRIMTVYASAGSWTYGAWNKIAPQEKQEESHKTAFGSISVSANKAVTINYSAAGFTAVPCICVSYSKTGSNSSGSWPCLKVYNKTTTSATIVVGGSGSTAYAADWIAVGK